MLKQITTICAFLITSLAYGQINLIVAHKGIAGTSLILDSSNISDVIKVYGTNYVKTESKYITCYEFESLGLTFNIHPYDKNEIVRSISLEHPFQGTTESGITLNKSTMEDVWKLDGEKTYFSSGNYAFKLSNGISYYVKKIPVKKKINPAEVICRIELRNPDKYNTWSTVNFEFNKEPMEKKLKDLTDILQKDPFSFEKLDSFWAKENPNNPYALEKRTEIDRTMEYGLTQQKMQLSQIKGSYTLIIIKYGQYLVYLKLSSGSNVLVEKIQEDKLREVLEARKTITDTRVDITNSITFPSELHTYGSFCGLHGSLQPKCQEMITLIKNDKYDELAGWLRSMNPEIAAYGYTGLFILGKMEVEIKRPDLIYMTYLKTLKTILYTCEGCGFGAGKTMKEVLQEDILEKMYQRFLKSGLFQ